MKTSYPQGLECQKAIGYHVYNWSFIGTEPDPFSKQAGERPIRFLDTFAPQAIHSLKAMASTMVNIRVKDGLTGVLNLIFSADNLTLGRWLLAMGMRLYPEEQQAAHQMEQTDLGEGSLYSVLYSSEKFRRQRIRKNWAG